MISASLRLALLLASSALVACSGSSSSPAQSATSSQTASTASGATKVTAFTISNENLRVDKVGMRDGALTPDGSVDLVFTATVDGPFDAVFIYSTNEKGEPTQGLRADTIVAANEIPPELGSVVDTGKMTFGLGVVENGKMINAENGSVRVSGGAHQLTFYVPNSANIKEGDYVRLWVRAGGALIASAPVKY